MIHFKHISKVFHTKSKTTKALDDVSLRVNEGTIFGVIGYSGAGKSTLIRMANLLEKPTEGQVFFRGKELTTMSKADLKKARKKMGMIFQSFNLLTTGTVYENISIPLKLTGVPKKQIKERVHKYLEIVGLKDKMHTYPSQLSGGQKQRVAIARALAHEPEVLLCDEATSALDPDTTDAILALLNRINQELGITILLITHEMNVVQNICHEVAVMDNGRVVEQGQTVDIFARPQTQTAKRFVNSLFNDVVPEQLVESLQDSGQIVTLSFVGHSSGQPALAMMTKKFDVYPSILSGNIAQLKDQPFGRLVIHLKGSPCETEQAINYLTELGVIVEGYKIGGVEHVG